MTTVKVNKQTNITVTHLPSPKHRWPPVIIIHKDLSCYFKKKVEVPIRWLTGHMLIAVITFFSDVINK